MKDNIPLQGHQMVHFDICLGKKKTLSPGRKHQSTSKSFVLKVKVTDYSFILSNLPGKHSVPTRLHCIMSASHPALRSATDLWV